MLDLDFGKFFSTSNPLSLYVRNGLGDNNLMGTTGDYASMGKRTIQWGLFKRCRVPSRHYLYSDINRGADRYQ